jgi:hypothetical protein
MPENDRTRDVAQLLTEHNKRSLRHIRDPYMILRLADEIIKTLDRGNPIWRKWEGPRETLIKSATICWVPIDDLRERLNRMTGPHLTHTDVEQRLAAAQDEQWEFADEDLRAGCLELYGQEKALGTELPAIIGALRRHVECERDRLQLEREAARREQIAAEKAALRARYRSGADCKWMTLDDTKDLYCRMNGRDYRLVVTPDKRLDLLRIDGPDAVGRLIGRYQNRGAVTKVLAQVAYQPEPL